MRHYTSKEDRVWRHISPEPNTGCWLWAGHVGHFGYGRSWDESKRGFITAHRMVYEALAGPIPAGLFLCHRCDNPSCVNPAHFFLGTKRDNNADKIAKGRQARGRRIALAKLDEPLVREMRAKYAAGGVTIQELADEFGVANSGCSRIINRKLWGWVA